MRSLALFLGVHISSLLWYCEALNGDTSKQSFNAFGYWQAFEVITKGDTQGSYRLPGKLDGIGAYLVDSDRIRLLLNHENTPGPGNFLDCEDRVPASVTEVHINKASLQNAIKNMVERGTTGGINFVDSFGLAYDTLIDENGMQGFDFLSFAKFCSGQGYAPNTFAVDDGFVDQLYIYGEEIGANGRLFAIENKTMYQLSGAAGDASGLQEGFAGMPFDSFENAALVRTSETNNIALLLSPDGGSKKLKIYIGQKGKGKDGSTDTSSVLARNGLAFGSWFYLEGSLPVAMDQIVSGSFGMSSDEAITADKLEDVDTNPNDPKQVVLAETKSGVYMLDFALDFTGGTFQQDASSFTITMMAKAGSPIDNPDNVEWTKSNSVFVNSDSCEGGVWEIVGGETTKIASTKDSTESTGILDISDLVNYPPASILLANTQGCSSSLSVLVRTDTLWNPGCYATCDYLFFLPGKLIYFDFFGTCFSLCLWDPFNVWTCSAVPTGSSWFGSLFTRA